MITVESVNTENFEKGLHGLIGLLGLNAKTVVKVESARLLQSLVRLTPPKDVAATRKAIAEKTANKFSMAGIARSGGSMLDTKGSFFGNYIRCHENARGASATTFGLHNGIEWFGVTPQTLYGVGQEWDKRNADQDELARLSYTLTAKGRQTLNFVNRNTKQKVRLIRNIMTDPEKVMMLIKRLQRRVGRLKAAWAVIFDSPALTGVKKPAFPKYVKDNLRGAKGASVDGLTTPHNPSFTIINRAKGASSRAMQWALGRALEGRAKAMQTNMRLMFEGKKSLADYAKN